MTTNRLAVLLATVALVGTPGLAVACSCTPQTDLDHFCSAKQVVVADVVATERRLTLDTGIQATDFRSPTIWEIHFRTAEVLKGEPLLYGLAITPGFEAECGLLLQPGKHALIFLDNRGGVHACNGSIADLQASKEGQASLGNLRQLTGLPNEALQRKCAARPSR
jgi:hypothetical protein